MVWTTLALAIAFAIPTLVTISTALAKTPNAEETSAGSDQSLSKEDQAKLKEHNKLRAEITRVKYPASKSAVVSHIKGIKADDMKWFEETLPDRTYGSADEVMLALGWQTSPPPGDDKAVRKPHKPSTSGKGEKTAK
jgi:hypothetical protein